MVFAFLDLLPMTLNVKMVILVQSTTTVAEKMPHVFLVPSSARILALVGVHQTIFFNNVIEIHCNTTTGICVNNIASGYCLMEGSCYSTGTYNPDNKCQVLSH